MRASSSVTSVVLFSLLASPAFAAPIATSKPTTSEPSTGAQIAAGAAGGAASGAVGNILTKIESLFRRDFDGEVLARDFKSTIATLSPADQKTVKTALINKISTLKDSDLATRSTAGDIGGAVAGGAASAVVGNLLSKIESLFRRQDGFDFSGFNLTTSPEFPPFREIDPSPPCDGSVCPDLDIARRSDENDSLSRRASTTTEEEEPSTGAQIAAGAAGGAASGAVGNILSKIESLFRRDFTDTDAEVFARDFKSTIATLSPTDKQTVKTALVNKISTLKDSDLATRSTAGDIGGAVAGGAASAVVGNLLTKIESLFRRDFGDEVFARDFKSTIATLSPADRQTVKTALINKVSTLKDSDLATRGAVGAIGGAVAGGAASAVVGNILSGIESLFRREEELAARGLVSTGVTKAAGGLIGFGTNTVVGDALNKIESLFRRASTTTEEEEPSTGAQIAAGAAGGAASGAVGNLLSKIESLFRRDFDDEVFARDFKSTIATLSPADQQTVKTALVNKISTLKDSDLAARSTAGDIGGAVAGGAASAVVGNLLTKIESLFRRELELQSDVLARTEGWSINELD